MNSLDLLPPIILRLARRWRRYMRTGRDTFSSFEEAQRNCRGYKDDHLLKVIYHKTIRLRDGLVSHSPPMDVNLGNVRMLIALGLSRSGDRLNVIDFGGSCGVHYFIAKAILGNNINLRWHVVDTPEMIMLARTLEDGRLRFFDDLSTAANAFEETDLIFASSSIHYTPDPCRTLRQFTDCQPRHIFITRTGFSDEPGNLVTVQRSHFSDNGPGPLPDGMEDGEAEFVLTIVPRRNVQAILSEHYDVMLHLHEEKRIYVFDRYELDVWGYFARKRSKTDSESEFSRHSSERLHTLSCLRL